MARAVLCPRCRHLIGSEETVCSWCGTSRSAAFWRILNWSRYDLGSTWVIKAIVTVNLLYFAASLVLAGSGGFLSPSRQSLLLLGATGTVPIDYYGNIWSLLTANYLHGGLLHLIFNLTALYQIAPLAVNEYGASRMFIIYTLGGVAGFVLSYVAGISFTIGASAAVCSLVGSLIYYGKSRGGGYGSAVYQQLTGWVISIFVFGLLFPGINNWGHGGGLLAGALLGMVLGYNDRKRENSYHHALALLCGLATVAALAATLWQSL